MKRTEIELRFTGMCKKPFSEEKLPAFKVFVNNDFIANMTVKDSLHIALNKNREIIINLEKE